MDRNEIPVARRKRGALVGLAMLCLLLAQGCEDSDPNLIVNVGVGILFINDPGLASQSIDAPEGTIQVAQWDLQIAALTVESDPPAQADLLGPPAGPSQPCEYFDTVASTPIADGICSNGIVLESGPDPVPVRLNLELTMVVRRAEPVSLPPMADFDADGVKNDSDNCPLLPNRDQADSNEDGIGNVCSIFDPFSGLSLLDSDGDGVFDSSDNCVWKRNPGQEDTMGLTEERQIPDGIGDACTEQIATVEEAGGPGGPTIILAPAPELLTQPLASNSFLVVDFNDTRTLECNWTAGSCILDPAAVRFCTTTNPFQALTGCPD